GSHEDRGAARGTVSDRVHARSEPVLRRADPQAADAPAGSERSGDRGPDRVPCMGRPRRHAGLAAAADPRHDGAHGARSGGAARRHAGAGSSGLARERSDRARREPVPQRLAAVPGVPLDSARHEPGRSDARRPRHPGRRDHRVGRVHGRGDRRRGLYPRVDRRSERPRDSRRDVLGRGHVVHAAHVRRDAERGRDREPRRVPDELPLTRTGTIRMRYKSQAVAYWYFAVAIVLFGLQIVFGLLSAAKYLGPDPLLYILPFDVTKVIHTNLLIVWVLLGFMGATYWLVPEESRTELHSVKLAYVQLALFSVMGVTAIIGYLFRYGTGNKLLEQPLPHKIAIVVTMLIFLYNIGMTIKKA